MPEERFTINITVAGKRYPLTILRSDEEKIRKAAKLINEKVERYKSNFEAAEKVDYLAMAAIQLVTQLVELQDKNADNPIMDTLRELDEELNEIDDISRI